MERGHYIETGNTAYFRHDYDGEHADMRRLYEQAKLDQWNAATDIDWEKPLDSDGGLIADDLVDIHGSPFWDRLSPAQRVEINRLVARWRISTLMHGEHGAMLVCSQMVENVVGQDAKLFQATQVVDEARHNEVLHRYVTLRLDGETYPLAGNVQEIFDTLLGTNAWYLKTIGLQLVAETFAVSLFRMLAESSKDAILRQVCRRILQDAGVEHIMEARDLVDGYRLYRRHRPDAVIVDLELHHRELDGLSLIQRIHAHDRRTRILVFSMHCDPAIVARALEAGALGYVNKDTSSAELVRAFEQVMAGTPYLSNEIAMEVALARTGLRRNPLDDLTPRELQTLTLLARGMPYGDIAEELNLSYKTVANVCSELKRKLGARNLPDLIRIAVQSAPNAP